MDARSKLSFHRTGSDYEPPHVRISSCDTSEQINKAIGAFLRNEPPHEQQQKIVACELEDLSNFMPRSEWRHANSVWHDTQTLLRNSELESFLKLLGGCSKHEVGREPAESALYQGVGGVFGFSKLGIGCAKRIRRVNPAYAKPCGCDSCDGSALRTVPMNDVERTFGPKVVTQLQDAAAVGWRRCPVHVEDERSQAFECPYALAEIGLHPNRGIDEMDLVTALEERFGQIGYMPSHTGESAFYDLNQPQRLALCGGR